MIPYAKEAGALVLLALLTFGGWKLYAFGYENGHNAASVKAEQTIAAFAKAEAEAQAKARASEQARVETIAEIGAKHASELGRIEREVETLVAGIRSGNIRLRQHWQSSVATCGLSRDSAAALHAEQIAQLRAEAIGRVRGIGAEADAQVKGLQDAYEAVRQ